MAARAGAGSAEGVYELHLDAFVEAMRRIAVEAAESPELLREAPHDRPVERLDEVGAVKRAIVRYEFGEPEPD